MTEHDTLNRPLIGRRMLRGDENGSIIVVALLFLVILTFMGISAVETTVTENKIAVNDQLYKMAFYSADSGVYATPKVIRAFITEGDPLEAGSTDLPGITKILCPEGLDPDDCENKEFPEEDSSEDRFYRQIMGYVPHADSNDVRYELAPNTIEVDVKHIRVRQVAGGGAEFGAGYEGVGVGSMAGTSKEYGMYATAEAPRNSKAQVTSNYRYVIGVTGGL
ncbi:MAG: pilus assembly PilX N-terminal domain-containing protein [Desulfamplus sp.]|nr:pilus assembly PilX N-terminal domain-containing protein [Desulfamplus sp.]